MKVAVIGNGKTGMAVFNELRSIPRIEELILVGRNMELIRSEVEDYIDARTLSNIFYPRLSWGGYEATAKADIIVYTAGASNTKDRQSLFGANVEIAKDVFGKVMQYNNKAIIVNLVNPLDGITYMIQKVTGLPARQVIGSGTLLDTARMKKILMNLFEISASSIEMYVMGEHGNSMFVPWSCAKIAGMSLKQYCNNAIGSGINLNREMIEKLTREAGLNIFNGKGATAYGVACAVSRIVSAICNNSNEIFPISTLLSGEYGLNDCYLSVPCKINEMGIAEVLELKLNKTELKRLHKSAGIIMEKVHGYYENNPK